MKLDAISVGKPREVKLDGRTITTSIFKTPVSGPQKVYFNHIEGDQQSDLKLHGGPTRPISVYASEYYDFWKDIFKIDELPWGYFGENLNITGGVFETEINVGDRFSIGNVELEALQPRFPCHKLGMKLGDKKWIKFFLESRKTGFYFGVLKEGTIKAGDTVTRTYTNHNSITMDDITDLYLINRNNKPLLQKALGVERLPQSWKEYFQEQLSKAK
ncbi:MAG: MOSC domain-containing protein [Cyclobacteriaceae bacterium]